MEINLTIKLCNGMMVYTLENGVSSITQIGKPNDDKARSVMISLLVNEIETLRQHNNENYSIM